MSDGPLVALFVTAHGFGHAARACALVEALHRARTDLRYLFVGEVPRWFLEDSLPGIPWTLAALVADVAPVQRTSLQLDLAATRARVRRRIPPSEQEIEAAAEMLAATGVGLVVSDISPLGLLAGHRTGLPTALVENFTWDWIYRRLSPGDPALGAAADWLESCYGSATLRIQVTPCCRTLSEALQVGALARAPRQSRRRTRSALGVGAREVLALLSMGGVPWRYEGLEVPAGEGLRAVAVGESPGAAPAGVVQLPHRSRFHHPDLVAAADVVVGKLGYSTLAEAWQAGCAYLWVERTDFPEIPVLEAHARRVLRAAPLPARALASGEWASAALALARREDPGVPWRSGGEAAAAALLALL